MTTKFSRRAVLAGVAASALPMPAIAQAAPVRIGLLTIKTGSLAEGGIQMEQGITTFLKEKNNTLGGRKAELVVADTGGTPAGAKTKAQELIERDKVDVILGPLAAFELLAILNVKRNFDAGASVVFAAAFKGTNVCGIVADDAGDSGEHAGTVFREDAEPHGKRGVRSGSPLNRNPALGFVKQIFNVGTILAVNRDPAAARDVADDLVAGNRVATFRAVNHQIAVAANNDRGFVDTHHALERGVGLGLALLGRFGERFAGQLRKYLTR